MFPWVGRGGHGNRWPRTQRWPPSYRPSVGTAGTAYTCLSPVQREEQSRNVEI